MWISSLLVECYMNGKGPCNKMTMHVMTSLLCCAGTGKLDRVAQCTADVIGLDWHTDMADARAQLGRERVLQGNMDPMLLFAPQVTLHMYVQTA